MRILITKREPLSLADGISHFIFSLANAFRQLGHEVICATSHDTDLETKVRDRFDHPQYPRLEALSRGDEMGHIQKFRLWRQAGPKLAARFQPDLVIINGALPCRFPCRSVLVAHDVEPRRLGWLGHVGRRAFKLVTYRLADRVVVSSPELVTPVARECRIEPGRIGVIPTCVDTSRYHPLPLARRQPVILHCGQQPYKRADVSLAAFQFLADSNARLVVVGRRESSFEALLNQVPVKWRARVEMPGIVSAARLKDLLASARLLTVPSDYAIPVASPTALEGLASHTPTVVSPSVSPIVSQNGESCFVENTPAGMARRFGELLNQDELWEKMSARCAIAKVRFDAVNVAKEYLALV